MNIKEEECPPGKDNIGRWNLFESLNRQRNLVAECPLFHFTDFSFRYIKYFPYLFFLLESLIFLYCSKQFSPTAQDFNLQLTCRRQETLAQCVQDPPTKYAIYGHFVFFRMGGQISSIVVSLSLGQAQR